MKIHFDTAPKTSLHWFKNPLKIIKACHPAEVSIALEELQKYLDDGYWIAGLTSYEYHMRWSQNFPAYLIQARSFLLFSLVFLMGQLI